MRPGDAVLELTRLGFRLRLDGGVVKVKFEGEQTPDPAVVAHLVALLKAHKSGVADFLRCYCPQCGGCCFAPGYEGERLCLVCDWQKLADLYPGLRMKH